jgi:heat shock protein HslJ
MNHAGGRRCLSFAMLLLAMILAPTAGAVAQTFPYGRELLLDAAPMRGSKKLPVLDIGDRGTAEIELWCSSVNAQLVVAGNTITIITGAMTARTCPPDLAAADSDLVAALNQVTNWRLENAALVLTGGRTLRFRLQTN